MTRLILLVSAAIFASSANAGGPSKFYVVTVLVPNSDGLFYYRVLDVRQDGADSIVRYARIAPRNSQCLREIVQAVEARVRDTTPAQLVGENNPCAVSPGALRSKIGKGVWRTGDSASVSTGVVAQCDSRTISFTLPTIEQGRLKRLTEAHPEMVHLWSLVHEVVEKTFSSKDMFRNRTEQDDLALQREGEKLVPDLVAGRFDAGLKKALHATGESQNSFRSILGNDSRPFSFSDAREVPRLLNADRYRFRHFVAPSYPRLAKMARIQGPVELKLTVERVTGKVVGVTLVLGHPLLAGAAIEAAKQWQFEPESLQSETVNVILDFEIRCPMPAMID